jgi:hypothetical protein
LATAEERCPADLLDSHAASREAWREVATAVEESHAPAHPRRP